MPELGFDMSTVDEDDRAVLPAGTYISTITKSELKDTKSGAGSFIRVYFKVASGQYANRSFGNNYNVRHRESQDAERIGRQQLKSLAVACGKPDMKATEELHGCNVAVTLEVDGSYNNVTAVAAAAQGQGQAPAATGGEPQQKAPWD